MRFVVSWGSENAKQYAVVAEEIGSAPETIMARDQSIRDLLASGARITAPGCVMIAVRHNARAPSRSASFEIPPNARESRRSPHAELAPPVPTGSLRLGDLAGLF